MSKKKYFPHKWALIKQCPSIAFPTIEFDHFMEWKVAGWEIPDQISCLIRTEHGETGKIKEYTYKSTHYAQRKVAELLETGDYDITICTHDTVHFIPQDALNDDDTEDS